jgi:tetratricopeptide (TPR) repeat protein
MAALAERTAGAALVRLDPEVAHWAGAIHAPASVDAYREFKLGFDLMLDANADSTAMLHLRRAAALDTGFVMPLLAAEMVVNPGPFPDSANWAAANAVAQEAIRRPLTPFEQALFDYLAALASGNWPSLYEAAQRVAAAAPGSEWLILLGRGAYVVGRAREAARVFASLDPDMGWLARDRYWWLQYLFSLHLTGEYERELAIASEMMRRWPTDRILLQAYLIPLAALGRTAAVDSVVDAALALKFRAGWVDEQPMLQTVGELEAHGYREAARGVAERTVELYRERGAPVWPDFLYAAGRVDEALAEAERLARKDTTDRGARTWVAVIAAERGDRATARRIDAQLARHRDVPWDIEALDRARIAAALGERAKAVQFLRDVIRLVAPLRRTLHIFPEFGRLRGYPPYEELIRPVD